MKLKIVIEPRYWKKPANEMVASLQLKTIQTINAAKSCGLEDLHHLEAILKDHLFHLAANLPRCNPADIEFDLRDLLLTSGDQVLVVRHKRDHVKPTMVIHLFNTETGRFAFHTEAKGNPMERTVVEL